MYIEKHIAQCNFIIDSAKLTKCWSTWGGNTVSVCDQIYFILDGKGTICIDGEEYHPTANQVVLIPKGSKVEFSTDPDDTYYKYWCHFNSVLMDKSLLNLIKMPRCFDVDDPTAIGKLFSTLVINYESDKPFSNLYARAALMQILAHLFRGIDKESTQINNEVPIDTLEQINMYIREHLDEHITLEQLADVLHFHPNYFIKFFNKNFGISPLQHVAQMRIEEAKRLLRNTELSVKEIASNTGFYDLYHFSKRFKAMTGYSPTDYRRL